MLEFVKIWISTLATATTSLILGLLFNAVFFELCGSKILSQVFTLALLFGTAGIAIIVTLLKKIDIG